MAHSLVDYTSSKNGVEALPGATFEGQLLNGVNYPAHLRPDFPIARNSEFFAQDIDSRAERKRAPYDPQITGDWDNHFVGIRHQACLNSQVLLHILDSLPSGITEIMCHPGYVDEPMKEFSRIPPHRETELRGLKDPMVRERIAANGIHLTHYGEL